MEERLELVLRHQNRVVCGSLPFILLLAENDPVPEEKRGISDPGRPHSSNGSKIVLTLLTEVVVIYVGLSVIYVQGTSFQLLPERLGDDGS